MGLSYSFHISAKSHAVSNIGKVGQVGKHNLRLYESEEYSQEKISVLVGSDNMLNDIKQIYHAEFDEELNRYNSCQRRAERKIEDYLKHVSESRNDVAVEVIIQVGDKDFWERKKNEPFIKTRIIVSEIFERQLEMLGKACPEFKIASAVIHFDESSPHMHVVGIPVAKGYKKGMRVQCCKTKVFTRESLSELQDRMHEHADVMIARFPKYFEGEYIQEKGTGRNKDIPKQLLDEFYALQKDVRNLRDEKELLVMQRTICKDDYNTLVAKYNELAEQYNELFDDVQQKQNTAERLEADLNTLKADLSELNATFDILSGKLEKELTRAKFKSLDEMRYPNYDAYRKTGELIALYHDGSVRQVGYNPSGGMDYQTLDDKDKGLCDVGIITDEPRIRVPRTLLRELMMVRDKELPISQNLQKLIEQQLKVARTLDSRKRMR